ncbi:hypothetical protein SATMO3_44830 [Sporomusa aerivorans]
MRIVITQVKRNHPIQKRYQATCYTTPESDEKEKHLLCRMEKLYNMRGVFFMEKKVDYPT